MHNWGYIVGSFIAPVDRTGIGLGQDFGFNTEPFGGLG
jgi:hypothetical protein